MSNTTNYGWAYVHPTLGIGLTRGPENSLTFQNSATADIDSNGMGQASGSANLTFDSSTHKLSLAGSADITESDGTLAPLTLRQDGTGDIFRAFDNTTEVFSIIDGGNVGIGQIAPTYKLHVQGDGYFHSNLTINGNLTVNGTNTIVNSTTIELDDKNIELAKGVGNNAAVDGGGITLVSSDGNKTIIYNNENVSWKFSEHVEVANGKHLRTDKVRAQDGDGLFLEDDGGNGIFIKDGGSVGIGTTTPDAVLDIKGTGAADNEILRLSLDGDRDWSFAQEGSAASTGLRLRSTAAKDFHVDATSTIFRKHDGSGEVMRIEPANGKVGIGTASPTTKLEVAGTIKATALTLGSAEISEAELEILDGALVTTDELNTLDGDGSSTSPTIVSTDKLILNDGGTMTQVGMDNFETYFESALDTLPNVTSIGTLTSLVVDNIAINGNDIQANTGHLNLKSTEAAKDIIFEVDTGGGEAPALTLDGSDNASAKFTPAAGGGLSVQATGENKKIDLKGGEIILTKASDTAELAPSLLFNKSRGTMGSGGETPPNDNDTLGTIGFSGFDSASSFSAGIEVKADGAHGSGGDTTDAPGKIIFKTTPDGSDTLADRMVIKSDGTVGIGNTNPSEQPAEKNDLVIGDNTGNRGMTIASTNTGVGTIRFAPNTAVNDIEGWIDYSGNTKKMRFGTNGLNTRMTIDNAGNLGVGVASPTRKLHVDGDVLISAEKYYYVTGDGGGYGSDHLGNIKIKQNGSDLIFGSGDNIGIGTATPAEKLTIDTGNIQLTNGYQIQWGDSENAIFGNTVSDYVRIKTAGLDRLSVDSTGKVGIGEISPDTVLHAVGNSGLTIEETGATGRKLIIEPPTGATVGIIKTHDTGAGLLLKSYNAGNQLFLKDDGNVGIGMTVPNEKLTVEGAISLDHISSPGHTAGYGKLYAKSDNNLYFKSATGTETNLITAGGSGGSTFNVKLLNDHGDGGAGSAGDGAGAGAISITHGSGETNFSDTDYFLAIQTKDGNTNTITITLPDASTREGKVYLIKDISGFAGTNNISIAASAGGAIEPSAGAGVTLNSNKAAVQCIALGSNWHLF